MRPRALVVGMGNLLRGDDGFGVEVVRRLQSMPEVTARARVIEIGIGGVHLVQELMDGYDLLVIVDAVQRGGAPGRLSVLEIEVPPAPPSSFEAWQAEIADVHQAVPDRALVMARSLGVLPPRVLLVGCEPERTEEVELALSPRVAAAVVPAAERIRDILRPLPAADPVLALQRRDEVLQVMFWIEGEGLGPAVTPADLRRFIEDGPALAATLAELVESGHVQVEAAGAAGARYRLTALGQVDGRRRFLDEFEPYLARQSHGECGSADCDCRTGGECREAR